MGNKQLFEKQSNSYKPIYPLVRLEDIIDTISNKSIQWILNNYNHIYVEYSESVAVTRNKVPQLLRRTGIWISYNAGTEVVTEYYKGDNKDVTNFIKWTNDDNWERFDKIKHLDGSITYQHLSESLRQLIGQGNNITNFPDDEDLEVKDGLLKLKDRDFEPNNFSGLGRVILRKNIKAVDGQPKNVLIQDMINKENTIYEIRYDFDLGGQEITIPEDCVLDFQGGSLNNGNVIGNNTAIKAELVKIFGLDINLSGSWNVLEAYPEWFGAKGDNNADDYEAINKTINCFKIVEFVNKKTYKISKSLVLSSGHRLNGNKCILWKYTSTVSDIGDIIVGDNNNEIIDGNVNAVIIVTGRFTRVSVSNFELVADNSDLSYGIFAASLIDSKFNDLFIWNCDIGIACGGLVTTNFTNIEVSKAKSKGIYAFRERKGDILPASVGTSTIFNNCFINYTKDAFDLKFLNYSTIIGGATDNSEFPIKVNSGNITVINLGMEQTKAIYLTSVASQVTMINCSGDMNSNASGYYFHFSLVNSKVNIIGGFYQCNKWNSLAYVDSGNLLSFDGTLLDNYNSQKYPIKYINWSGDIYNTVEFKGNQGYRVIYGKSGSDSINGTSPEPSFLHNGSNVYINDKPYWVKDNIFLNSEGIPKDYKISDCETLVPYSIKAFNANNDIKNCPTSYGLLECITDSGLFIQYYHDAAGIYSQPLYRKNIGGSWTAWSKINLTTI